MSSFTFTNPETGQAFEVKGPPGLSYEQAKQIFDQQLDAGSLVGLTKGQGISAAKQAAAGLAGAAGQVTQALAGIAGSAQGALSSAINVAKNAASGLPGGLNPSSLVSQASAAVKNITGTITKTPVTNGIGLGDFAKTIPALVPIQGMSTGTVTAAMSQAQKLVGQSSSIMTNASGVGSFGFDVTQLERAGIVKPGTASTYLATGANQLTDVLKSPAVFTGQNGITDVTKLLGNPVAQAKIQQNLMSSGLSEISQAGIPLGSLNPSALAGTALNAAKSVPQTLDWAAGGGLAPNVKAAFDQTARDGAFAADFAEVAVDDAMLALEPGDPAIDTVNRDTLDAASKRITGNSKIPPTDYTTPVPTVTKQELEEKFDIAANEFGRISDEFQVVARKSDRVRDETNSYAEDIRNIERLINDLNELDATMTGLIREAENLQPPDSGMVARIQKAQTFVPKTIKLYEGAVAALRTKLSQSTA